MAINTDAPYYDSPDGYVFIERSSADQILKSFSLGVLASLIDDGLSCVNNITTVINSLFGYNSYIKRFYAEVAYKKKRL